MKNKKTTLEFCNKWGERKTVVLGGTLSSSHAITLKCAAPSSQWFASSLMWNLFCACACRCSVSRVPAPTSREKTPASWPAWSVALCWQGSSPWWLLSLQDTLSRVTWPTTGEILHTFSFLIWTRLWPLMHVFSLSLRSKANVSETSPVDTTSWYKTLKSSSLTKQPLREEDFTVKTETVGMFPEDMVVKGCCGSWTART